MQDTVSLSIDVRVANRALALGLDLSRLAEAAISEAAHVERKRLRQVQYRAGFEACSREVAWTGPALTQ